MSRDEYLSGTPYNDKFKRTKGIDAQKECLYRSLENELLNVSSFQVYLNEC